MKNVLQASKQMPCRTALGHGFPIVLTADRTLMAAYKALFDGMMSASQTTMTPSFMMRLMLAPRVASDGLRARQAPLGLRRIEAALVRDGWTTEDVAIVRPGDIGRGIGPETRVIGMASGDPLGLGMNSNTMTGIAGGQIYTSRWFRRLAHRIGRVRSNAPDARVVMGGPGAWQLAQCDDARRELGIDHVILGYAETSVAEVFRRIAAGEAQPPVIHADRVTGDQIPCILGPTVMGSVEISRGCGLGCQFCTIGRSPMTHLPVETILSDIRTNVDAGVTSISLVTEDLFRYGAEGHEPRPGIVIDLLRQIRGVAGLGLLQTDHANITSIAQFSDEELREVHRLFVPEGYRHDYLWLNLGVETAAGKLLAANGGQPKMRPYAPEEWGHVCLEQVRRLTANGFFPLISLLMGMPGEQEADIDTTVEWVQQLLGDRVAIFPMFFAPINPDEPTFGVEGMSPAHWRLFRTCYRLNFKWMPQLCWDNQTAAGVSLWKRVLMQTLGRGQVVWWKMLFVLRAACCVRGRET